MIAANDFRRQGDEVRADVLAAVERVGASGWYVLGQEVREFEQALAKTWGLDHAVGVASGLDAIQIALRALGCGPGDRVLTTPLSAFATTLAIVRIGAIPVFVDTDDRGLIDLAACRQLLDTRNNIRDNIRMPTALRIRGQPAHSSLSDRRGSVPSYPGSQRLA